MVSAFLQGIFLAIGLVMPLGVHNTFVFYQAACQNRYVMVMPLIVSSIVADTILIVSAILGVDYLLTITWLKPAITILGIFFLTYMGFIIFFKEIDDPKIDKQQMSILQQVTFTFAVALLNPHAIIDTFGVIGSVSATYEGMEKQVFAFGCIFIDALWFASLAMCGYSIKKLNNGRRVINILNKVSGAIMWIIALNLTLEFLR